MLASLSATGALGADLGDRPMRTQHRSLLLMFTALVLAAGCASETSDPEGDIDQELGDIGGKSDFAGIENLPIVINARSSSRFAITAGAAFIVRVEQDTTTVPLVLIVEGGGADATLPAATAIEHTVRGPEESTMYKIRVKNPGTRRARARFSLIPAPPVIDEPTTGVPTLADEVVMQSDYCRYENTPPYVRDIQWSHPRIQAALKAIGPGWRSTFSYREWSVSYGLESDDAGTDEQKRNARARNFIRVLLGEHRDYPEMIEAKLDVLSESQVYAGPAEVTSFDTERNLFQQITYPAYTRMLNVMGEMHRYRKGLLAHPNDGFNYATGERSYSSHRVENSVPPTTHCEMKFMFSRYMVANAPRISSWATTDTATEVRPATYETQYADYRASSCSAEDLDYMYNFRGHKNFQPLWLDSNAFTWTSRRGRSVKTSRQSDSYYLRPVADRYTRGRQALASFLFYRDEDAAAMQRAGNQGGGPIMYVTDQDSDNDGLADYKLFPDRDGCGDTGLGGTNPATNCNMVPWELAASTPTTTGHASAWDPSLWQSPDMGFLQTFTTFETRMARFNQALDRHTNWGPTGYYMIDASLPTAAPNQIKFIGAYSPIVACSYDISASNSFASGDYPTTDSFESGRTKWMYVMRFRASDYYSEKDLRDGREIDFFRNYFNETSLSNDYYSERALDRFGFVPPTDIYANIYFVYGARGEQAPALTEIPAPPG